jgi:hypothetical protein
MNAKSVVHAVAESGGPDDQVNWAELTDPRTVNWKTQPVGRCQGCSAQEPLVNGICKDCSDFMTRRAAQMRPDNLRFAENPEL